MLASEVRFLYEYDRWATRRVLAVLDGLDQAVWSRKNVVDVRGLGGILVHHLGATERWRTAFASQGEAEMASREDQPLPSVDELRRLWDAEWAATDVWLSSVTDAFVGASFDGVPVWQMLVHVVNHGTQHRAEAAALLTAEGRSPGDLDLVDYAYSLVETGTQQSG